MRKIEFTKEKTIIKKHKNPCICLGHLNSKELKYLVPWAQYDEENRVVEHFIINKHVGSKSINNNITIQTLTNKLFDRQ